jgi:hypothetical protein
MAIGFPASSFAGNMSNVLMIDAVIRKMEFSAKTLPGQILCDEFGRSGMKQPRARTFSQTRSSTAKDP